MIPPRKKFRIFVSATSDGLTDFASHGDGLVAMALIRQLAARGHEVHVAGTAIRLREPLPANVFFYPLRLDGSESFVQRLRYAVAVRRLFDRLSRDRVFDVVHQMNPVVAGLSVGFAINAPPLVLGAYIQNWARDDDASPSLWRRLRGVGVAVGRDIAALAQLSFASAIIIATDSARDRVPCRRLFRKKIVVIPHGIDAESLVPVEPNAVAEEREPAILFLANLDRRKGIFTLLDAFEMVAERISGVRLIIAGRGMDAAVRAVVAKSRFSSRIELIGNVAREGIATVMRRASVYCLPSHGEPFGMTVLEAMSCGVPVVVTREGGLGEIVPDFAGRKAPMRDPKALAEALIDVLSLDVETRRRIGARNRAYAEDRFALPRIAERLEEIYDRVTSAALSRAVPSGSVEVVAC